MKILDKSWTSMNFLDDNYKLMNNLDETFDMLKCMDVLERTWKQARNETLKVHEMEQLY